MIRGLSSKKIGSFPHSKTWKILEDLVEQGFWRTLYLMTTFLDTSDCSLGLRCPLCDHHQPECPDGSVHHTLHGQEDIQAGPDLPGGAGRGNAERKRVTQSHPRGRSAAGGLNRGNS